MADLVGTLDWHVLAHPDRTHLHVMDESGAEEILSYADLQRGADAVAAGLSACDLQPGGTVAVMLPTCPEYFFSFFGILRAGGIPVPIYPPVRAAQVGEHLRRHARILANARATILITVPEARAVAQLLRLHVESLHRVVTVAELREAGAGARAAVLPPQEIAFLQYTSGSTGNPKGVMLTHANLLANIRAMGEAIQADSTDIFVSWMPLYHDMGLIGAWLGSLYHAIPLVVMSPLAFLRRPERWLWAIHRHRGTLSGAPNFGYELCLRHIRDSDIEGLDLGSWRLAFNGAEPVSPDTITRFAERFAPCGFRPEGMAPVYGLAESSVGLAFPPPGRVPVIDRLRRETLVREGRAVPAAGDDPHALRFVACGYPLAGHEIRIIDETGHEAGEREQGRLEFRGPSCTPGYYCNPEETRRLFHDGWLDSGDLAYVAGGEIFITGREKDMIIHAGRNVHPHELEEAIGNLSGIRKGCVAVFGCIDRANATERLVVMAETRETDAARRAAIITSINALAMELIGMPPDDVVLAPPHTVLKTSSGKVRHAASRAIYERGEVGMPTRALWRQITSLLLGGTRPLLRRALRIAGSVIHAGYVWLVFSAGAGGVVHCRPVAAAGTGPGLHPVRGASAALAVRHSTARARQRTSSRGPVCPGGEPCKLPRRHRASGGTAGRLQLRCQARTGEPAHRRAVSAPYRYRVRRALRPAAWRGGCTQRGPGRTAWPHAGVLSGRHVRSPAGPAAVPHGCIRDGARSRCASGGMRDPRYALHAAPE